MLLSFLILSTPADTMFRSKAIVVFFLLAAAFNALAGERGFLGMTVTVDAEGFFLSPTLKSVKVEKVVPDSPAAKAGLQAGDVMLEIEGHKVAGAKANDLKPYMERDVGQTLRLAVQKSSGEVKQVTLVAGPRLD